MTTSTCDVGDLFSGLSAQGIENQLLRIAGLSRVSVNPVSGSTTVSYDPANTNQAKLSQSIAAVSMSGSSALAAVNTLLLKQTKLIGIGGNNGKASTPAPSVKTVIAT